MKRNTLLLLLAVIVIVIGIVVAFKLKTNNNAAATVTSTATIAHTELLPADVSTLKPIEFAQTITVNGNIKATRQAQVKAQVSGNVLNVLVLEGQAVMAGTLLASIDAQDYQSRLQAQQAAVAQAQAQQAIAQRAVDNNKALVDKGFISNNAYDTAVQQLDAAKATVAVAVANLHLSKKAMEDTSIRAPIAGVVTEKLIAQGDKVSPDMKVFTIVAPGSIEFEGALPAAEATQLKIGQTLIITPEGLEPIKTTISRVNAAASAGSRAVSFFANLPVSNPAQNIRPGSYASAKVFVKSTTIAAVPQSAIRDDAGRSIVYTLTGSPATIASTPVKLGLRGESTSGEPYIAVDGIAPDTQYVSRNLGPLRVGSKVKITGTP